MTTWSYATEVESGNGRVAVSRSAFVFEIYGCAGQLPRSALSIYDLFKELSHPAELYILGSNDRVYKKLTPAAERRLRQGLPNGGFWTIKSAPGIGAGRFSCELVLGASGPWRTDVITIAVPSDWGEASQIGQCSAFFRRLCETFGGWGGVASWGFDIVWGREFEQLAMPEWFRLAMRYQGLMLRDRYQDACLVAEENGRPTPKFKSAGWLTFVGDDVAVPAGLTIPRLQGALGATCDVERLERGVLITAGTLPVLADVNHFDASDEPLACVNAVIAPLRLKRWTVSDLFGVDELEANRWFERFEHQ